MQRIIARLASRADAVAIFSQFGVALPGAETIANVIRLAETPLCGLRRFPVGVYAPPADVGDGDVGSLIGNRPFVVDTRADRVDRDCAAIEGRAPDIVRLRGDAAASRDGMTALFRDDAANETILVLDGFDASGLTDDLHPDRNDFVDEYAALERAPDRGAIRKLRYARDGVEVMLDPLAVLCEPDERQIDMALSLGAAVFDAEGALALAIPALSGDAEHWGAEVVSAVPPVSTPQSLVASSGPGRWLLQGEIGAEREAQTLRIEAEPAAEIAAIWIGTRRRRGRWEIWDEADAQLRLEESW